MYKIELFDPPTRMTEKEICFHNLKKANEKFDLKFMIFASMAWLEINPNSNCQDLEKYFRNNKFNTHLIASRNYPKNSIIKLRNKDCEYEMILSCRPPKYAIEELLINWPSYENNFDALKSAGIINVDIDSKNETDKMNEADHYKKNGQELKILNENEKNVSSLITKNKKIIEYIDIDPKEIINKYYNDAVVNFGTKPECKMIGMAHDGRPILAMMVQNKIVCPHGIIVDYANNIELIDLSKLK